jgi:hypothetical protein
MEPLNLMVSLSHFANDNREHKHGLSRPAGGDCRSDRTHGRHLPGALTRLKLTLQNLRRIRASRARVLS